MFLNKKSLYIYFKFYVCIYQATIEFMNVTIRIASILVCQDKDELPQSLVEYH